MRVGQVRRLKELEQENSYLKRLVADPLHPDNQLPYIDGLNGLIIPDTTVYHSVLQTGKLDVGTLDWQQAETFPLLASCLTT